MFSYIAIDSLLVPPSLAYTLCISFSFVYMSTTVGVLCIADNMLLKRTLSSALRLGYMKKVSVSVRSYSITTS
jgi:hypothetical protein